MSLLLSGADVVDEEYGIKGTGLRLVNGFSGRQANWMRPRRTTANPVALVFDVK
jgi:hypothetical protein